MTAQDVDKLVQLAERDENTGTQAERVETITARARLAQLTAQGEIPKPRIEGVFTLRELEALSAPEATPVMARSAA
jgi:hypothetical protein